MNGHHAIAAGLPEAIALQTPAYRSTGILDLIRFGPSGLETLSPGSIPLLSAQLARRFRWRGLPSVLNRILRLDVQSG